MDTTQKVSASTITGFLQSEDDKESITQGKVEPQRAQSLRHDPQQHQPPLYPPPPPPLTGYYPYYPPPMPPAPSVDYLYMDILKRLSLQSELHNYLPRCEGLSSESNPTSCHGKINRFQYDEKKTCDHSHLNDSRLCASCEQHFRCSCCRKFLMSDRISSTENKNCCNFCQYLLPVHSLMHLQHNSILSCNCNCQKQKETKHKSKQKSNKDKGNQTCLKSDHDNIPERDSPRKSMKRSNTFIKSYQNYESCDSEGENFSITDGNRDAYESDDKSEERRFGFYVGEGDENKNDVNIKKPGTTSRIRKTRRALAYFINV